MLNVNLVRNILKSKISYPAQHLILRLHDAADPETWQGADTLHHLLPDLGRNKFYQVLAELIEQGLLEREAERGPDYRYRQVRYRPRGLANSRPTVSRRTARDPDQLSLMARKAEGRPAEAPVEPPRRAEPAAPQRSVLPAADSLQLGLLWKPSFQLAIAVDTKRLQGNALHDQLLRYIVDRYQHYYQQYKGRVDTTLINRFRGLDEEHRDQAYELIAKLEMLCPKKGAQATGKEIVTFWEFVLKNCTAKGKEYFHFRNLTRLLQKYVEEAHQVAARAAERERKAAGERVATPEEQQAEREEQAARYSDFVTSFLLQQYQYRKQDKVPSAQERKALPALVNYLRQCWNTDFPVRLIPENLLGSPVDTADLKQVDGFLHQTLQGWVDQGLTQEQLEAFLRDHPYRVGESQSPPVRRSDPQASAHLAQRLQQRLAV